MSTVEQLREVFIEEGMPPGFDRKRILGALIEYEISPGELRRRIQSAKEFVSSFKIRYGIRYWWQWRRTRKLFAERFGSYGDTYLAAFVLDPSWFLDA